VRRVEGAAQGGISPPRRFLFIVQIVLSFHGDLSMASRNRGVRKQKLTDLIREAASPEESNAVVQEMMRGIDNTTPIVTAILGQALLESELDSMLRSRLSRKDDDTWAKLSEPPGPLCSFNSKILLCHAFKFYDDDFAENLHIVRKIRNVFAHSRKLRNFDHPLIVDELKKVNLPSGKRGKLYKSLKLVEGMDTPQGSFSILVLALSNDMVERTFRVAKISQRRRKKKAAQQYQMIARAMLGHPQVVIENFQPLGRGRQSEDPSSLSQRPLTLRLPSPPAESDDNGDK
jgi:hypothetical protein